MGSDLAGTFLHRLSAATTAHDLDALVDCFTEDYHSEAPTHPARSFTGAERVRANWRQIFEFVPDIRAKVTAWAADGTTVWSEWDMEGTRRDGTAHRARGVIVFGLSGPRASSARFYLELVDEDPATITEAVRDQVHAGDAP
jgi:ketosteroid isomerase-like protein